MITPGEILKDPALRESDEFRYWGHLTPLNTMLESLQGLERQQSLLDLDKSGDDVAYHTAFVLGRMPPDVVFRHYGEEGLVYVSCNASSSDVGERFQDALSKMAGYDKSLFEKARLWAWQKRYTSHPREVLAQYAVMETVTGGWLDSVDLQAVLRAAVKSGVAVGKGRLADYSLLPLCSQDSYAEPAGFARGWTRDFEPGPRNGHVNNKPFARYNIWLDAPTGFALGYKGWPQALVALECVEGRELMISQLQGVCAELIDPKKKYSSDGIVGRVASRGLVPFDWQRGMVTVAGELARELGLESLSIQGGENNVWRKKKLRGETEPHITAETAARAYDVPAERLGFTRLADGNWHRFVAPNTP